jgi:PAS domain S-box-containing protein
MGVTTLAVAPLAIAHSLMVALGAALALMATIVAPLAIERRRWILPLRRLGEQVDALAQNPAAGVKFSGPAQVEELVRSLNGLSAGCQRLASARPAAFTPPGDSGTRGHKGSLTKSALIGPASEGADIPFDSQASGEFPSTDMVNRLEPRLLRWLESSPAEQEFLGWDVRQLREKSFLEIVHPDDVARVREQLRIALVKGEVHGLILRIRTAHGKPRAIEMNIGSRYGADLTVSHLRCHITDVTIKVRAERELRLRTRELTQVNEQLRLINRELEELKERYRDLYQNAPAMYFSLDERGHLLECNDTLLRTLGYRRETLVGQSYVRLLPEALKPRFCERFAQFLAEGSIEVASQWVKANGEVIEVWVRGTAVRSADGRIVHSRSVAQDVTARHRLEAELHEKNDRLAQTIDELSRRNTEMDEFTYVVSHDLQEPLRTLIAFSDFLLSDYGERLDAEGQEFVRYIVDASRRMRALINDLLSLSRLGKVTAEFSSVKLESVIEVIRADLAELIRSKGAEVRVAGPLTEVWGDPARIGQLLANLISNGLKYNDKPGPIVEVGSLPGVPAPSEVEGPTQAAAGSDRDLDEWVTLFVRDNGIGIEPRFHARIFQLFRRLHTREEYEGTGAGLAICNKIVQAHGGRIWLESGPNVGSTFYVSLRRASAGALLEPPVNSTEVPHET